MHHFIEFFRAIRKSIAEDTLPEMIELIDIQQKAYDARVAATKRKNDAENENHNKTEANLKKIKIDEFQWKKNN